MRPATFALLASALVMAAPAALAMEDGPQPGGNPPVTGYPGAVKSGWLATQQAPGASFIEKAAAYDTARRVREAVDRLAGDGPAGLDSSAVDGPLSGRENTGVYAVDCDTGRIATGPGAGTPLFDDRRGRGFAAALCDERFAERGHWVVRPGEGVEDRPVVEAARTTAPPGDEGIVGSPRRGTVIADGTPVPGVRPEETARSEAARKPPPHPMGPIQGLTASVDGLAAPQGTPETMPDGDGWPPPVYVRPVSGTSFRVVGEVGGHTPTGIAQEAQAPGRLEKTLSQDATGADRSVK